MTDENADTVPATLPLVEIGFVSRDTGLRDFLVAAFRLDPQPRIELPIGELYRLTGYGTVLKVFVPSEAPAPQNRSDGFLGVDGLRFLTIRVDDLDSVVSRAVDHGGSIAHGPHEPVPGVRIAMIQDPDGNTYEVSERLS